MTSSPLPPLPISTHLYGLSNFASISLGPRVYLIGGSHFDANAFPLNYPSASAAAYVLDLASGPPSSLRWARLPDMRASRGSFACASLPGKTGFMVAGGGSRHTMYPSDGTRIDCVEWYDVASNTWQEVAQMPRYRAGCVGFLMRNGPSSCSNNGGEDELVVMGGYAEYTTVAGVVPADVYCRNAVALGLRSGKWREIGDMWEQGERSRLGLVTAVENEDGSAKGIFMLDANELFRYDFASNRWLKESSLKKKIPDDQSCGFTAMSGELFVLTSAKVPQEVTDLRRHLKKRQALELQVYNPERKKWRSLTTSLPLNQPIDFRTAVWCTIQL